MEAPVIAAIISSSIALLTAIGTSVFMYYRVERQKQKYLVELEEIKSVLDSKKSEHNARLDYEYEARKKLYNYYEPILFNYTESAERACSRIASLSKRAREKVLAVRNADKKWDSSGSWLNNQDKYYLHSTYYYLFAPVAYFRLFRNKLTYVDLRLDEGIYCTYILSKILFGTFADAFRIAVDVKKTYEPFKNPDIIRQDIPIGVTESICQFLTDKEQNSIIEYSDFEWKIENQADENVLFFTTILKEFHPERLDILWSVLIVQSVLYKVINQLRKKPITSEYMLIEQIKLTTEAMTTSEYCIPEHLYADFDTIKAGAKTYLTTMVKKYY